MSRRRFFYRSKRACALVSPGASTMPRPFRDQITRRTTTHELIRAGKSQYIRALYARLGPEEFYRRRCEWLLANGKTTSYQRLRAYLDARGIDVLSSPLTREGEIPEIRPPGDPDSMSSPGREK